MQYILYIFMCMRRKAMKYLKGLFFGIGCTFFISFASAAGFIEGLEDVPIMDGLIQLPGEDVSFGNEESRFVEARLESTNDRIRFPDVEKFYRDTLPQMGWYLKENRPDIIIFTRDSELMDIAIDSSAPLTIRITVKSQN